MASKSARVVPSSGRWKTGSRPRRSSRMSRSLASVVNHGFTLVTSRCRIWCCTTPIQHRQRHWDQRHDDDEDRDQPEVALDHRYIAEEVAAPEEDQHPGEAAEDVVGLEASVGHPADAGDEGHAGADDRNEARQ